MADLILEWGALGEYGTTLPDTAPDSVTATVDTGGVAVDITFDGQDAGAEAFTYNGNAYVGTDETFNPASHLKLWGDGGDGGEGSSATSTTVMDFRALDTATFTDNVQDVSFRLNDVDAGPGGDLNSPGISFEDVVSIQAYDAEGNLVPVSMSADGSATVTDGTVDGNTPSGFEEATGSVLVNIAGPVSRIEIVYENGGVSDQAVLISDVEFSTVDVGEGSDPDANDDTASTDVDTPVVINVLDNDTDPDGDPLSILTYTAPENGNVSVNPDGSMTYTPAPGFTGTDTFTYVVDDGTGGTDTAMVTVSVDEPENQAPTAIDDTATTPEDTAIVIDDPAGNDTDPDGDPLTVTDIGDPTNGTATLNPDGTVTYTPDDGFTGDDTIPYTVDDGNGGTDTGEIVVTVTPEENLPPTAVDDVAATLEDTPVVIADPSANDTDPEGDPLTVSDVGDPTYGTATLNPDGTVTYTPDDGYFGEDTIPYTVDDGNGGTDTGEIVVTVAPEEGRIDIDVFPVLASQQFLDPFNGLDQDFDPFDHLDNIVGTASADVISTGDDNDTIIAGGGDDRISSGIDNDWVDLGSGNDYLVDSQGADTILGGQGNDTILAGIDTFRDFVGDDPAFAPGSLLNSLGFLRDPSRDDGRDSIQGNQGNDFIVTGDDSDTIDGGADNDTIDAGIDNDSVMGGQGDDSILGGHGSDTLDGGQGDDFLDARNDDLLTLVDASDFNTENDRDYVTGALGNDTIITGDDDDTLMGGSGEDILIAGIDDDLLMGGDDDDTLDGGQGNDTLNGGAGVDSIMGGDGRDMIQVDSAADGTGDTVDGGSGVFSTDPDVNTDWDVLDLGGVGDRGVDWRVAAGATADSNGNGIDGTIEFLDGAGAVTGTMDFFEIEEIVCFTPGTLIATPRGERLVEDLVEGDRVITRDNGIQEIKWLGRKDLTGHDLARKPHFKPILIQKGALGNNLPEHDLLVSPNHRVLVANDKTALYFEEREVLVAAKHLTGLDGVDEVESLGVSYIHMMFENHEVILSNGAWTESFQPGDYSLKGIGNAQRQEIFELFPELEHAEGIKAYGAARRSLKKHEAALLTS